MKITVSRNNIQVSEHDLGELAYLGETSSFSIGRSDQCHVVLDDKKISREQAQVEFDGKHWLISSVSDYTVVAVNNIPITAKQQLNDNDVIFINDFLLKISIEASELPEEPEEATPVEEEATVTMVEETIPEEPVEEVEEAPSQEEEITEVIEEPTADESFDEGGVGVDELGEEGGDSFGESEEGFGEEGEYSEESYEDYGEEGEYSEDYGMEEYDDGGDDAGEKTQVFTGFAKFSLELFGEFAPYDSFNVTSNEVFIGRDANKCQIVLQDPEVSSVHAVIKKNNVTCSLEDLQSANGTILNGKRINKKDISNGDEFIIGGTTFTVHVGSEFIDSQKDMLMPVEENQVIEVEEVVEIDEDSEDYDEADFESEEDAAPEDNSLIGKFKRLDKKKKLIYGGIGIALFMMLMPSGGGKKKKVDPKAKTAKSKDAKAGPKKATKKLLSPEQAEIAESLYQLGTQLAQEGKCAESIVEFEKLIQISRTYKEVQTRYELAKTCLKELEQEEKRRREEEEKAKIRLQVAGLLKKAEVAVKERNVAKARSLFKQITALDPENYELTPLKQDIDAYEKEKKRKELEEAQKKAERKRMVDSLSEGKTLYLRESWYEAINALEKFLRIKGMDEDLIKEATNMLKTSKNKLGEVVNPLLGKARSLKEGEDLKGAYKAYMDILKYDPTRSEALNQLDEIRFTLTKRARKIYREGIVSESLGLYDEAKEKFQEVQQIAPEDNEYYTKATKRLKDL